MAVYTLYYMKKEPSIWISAVSLLLSVVAVCVAYIRSEPIQVEWASLLVGTLSALVAATVGWQIYNSISINKKVDGIKETATCITKTEMDKYGHSVKSFVLTLMARDLMNKNRYDVAIENVMNGLEEALQGSDPDAPLLAIGFLEVIKGDLHGKGYILSGKRVRYIRLLSQSGDERAGELIDFILNCEELPPLRKDKN